MLTATAPAVRHAVHSEPSHRFVRRGPGVALLAIVALAALTRLWGIGDQPVLYFDGGVYLGEGAFLASAAQRGLAALIAPGPESVLERVGKTLEQGTDAHPPDIAKPGHALLVAVAMLLLGKTVLAGALVSALAGIGTVVAAYALGMVGWGPRVAIPAALLLAVSGQHLVYSREPLVESDGLFFATVGALVYLKARRWRGLVGAGVLYGAAFSCNNRLGFLPAVLLLVELGGRTRPRALVRRGLALAGGFVLPLACIEGAYLIARAIGRAAGTRTDWLDYAQQLAAFTRMNPPDRWRPDQWPTYFVDLALMDGLPVLALFVAGLLLIVTRLRSPVVLTKADLLLTASLLVPLLLYSAYSTGEVRMRHFSLALPWVMLTAALALERLSRLAGPWQPHLMGIALVGLGILAVPRVVALDTPANGMPALLEALANGRVAGTNGPVLAFYVGEARSNARLREAFVNLPSDLDALAASYPTLVVDMQAYVFPGELTDRYDRATPRLSVRHGSDAWYLADLLEHYGFGWNTWDSLLTTWRAHVQSATTLRVYDLTDLRR